MPVTTTYYSIKSVTDIAKLAIEYRKIQEISKLCTELERQKSISESILSYTRLIKSDVQSLMHMYFKSAYENLNYALTASYENQNEYLRQARNRFIDATTIEKNENLILSYIGLALCQALTNDIDNSTKTISKIRNVYISLPDDFKELSSMMRYKNEWSWFLAHYMSRRISSCFSYEKEPEEISFNFAFKSVYFFNGNEHDLEQYIKRLLNALNTCGGISINGHKLVENNKRAIKIILQEDFDTLKTEVLSKFNILNA